MTTDSTAKEELNGNASEDYTPENEQPGQEAQFQQPADDEITVQADEVENLTVKFNEEKERYLRLYSDFENFRKQKIRERQELLQTAGSDVIRQLLPLLDDFDRAVISNESIDDTDTLKEGFKLIYQKLKITLERQGVKEMEALGQAFDTDLHEAITNIPAPKEDLKGKVVDVAEKGYYLNEKVIRFAKVIVGQ